MKTSTTNLVMEKRVNKILRQLKKLQDDEKPGKRKLRIGNMLRQMSKLKETMKKILEEEEKKLEEEETMRKKKLEEEEKQLEEEEKLKKWYEMIENDEVEKMHLEFESDEKLRMKFGDVCMYRIYLKMKQSRELPMEERMQRMPPRSVRCGGVPPPVYDRDDIFYDSVSPRVMAELRDYAKLVIDAFNKTHRTKYSVVEVVKAREFNNRQSLVVVDFTAKRDGDDDDDAKSLHGVIKSHGGGKYTHVTYADFTKT